jgi:serine/threonine protein kinase
MDIKPANIMLDQKNYLKIIDFGTSKDVTVEATDNFDGGTLGYSAPEVVNI